MPHKPKTSDEEALLIISNGSVHPDVFYATGFEIEAPVAYLRLRGRTFLFVNDLEYGRACAEARVSEVIPTGRYESDMRARGQQVNLPGIIDAYLMGQDVRRLTVPTNIAWSYARRLEELGYELAARESPFFPERAIKSVEEQGALARTQECVEQAMELAVATIAAADIRDGRLFTEGVPLTSEGLQIEIQKALLERHCLATGIIVAAGDQGSDPHKRGEGHLPSNQTIIIDIFSQHLKTRYWGDMTRTVVRGRASDDVKRLYSDVLDAQELALSMIRSGVDSRSIHGAVCRLLEERGNENGDIQGKKTGFFHATGHGIGLEIHEPPRMGRHGTPLVEGHAITVEPGLYYPGRGAVRIEDMVIVEKDGCRNLNKFPKCLEI